MGKYNVNFDVVNEHDKAVFMRTGDPTFGVYIDHKSMGTKIRKGIMFVSPAKAREFANAILAFSYQMEDAIISKPKNKED